MNYYNDHEKSAVAWLKELINQGVIPPGDVDDRSILHVRPHDLRDYTQCHFFSGIGGWPEALAIAGWPTDRPVWTGSCPCQPLSVAGLGRGAADGRHLWPVFASLILESAPAIVFGEQVASADGREWFSGVRLDLEAMGYAVGAADLCAAGVGAPHIRQRLWWVADSNRKPRVRTGFCTADDSREWQGQEEIPGIDDLCGVGDTEQQGLERHSGDGARGIRKKRKISKQNRSATEAGYVPDFWQSFELVHCLDGKSRRIEPCSPPLVNGFPGRVGLLRGYGNAINPWVGAEFIRAYMGI